MALELLKRTVLFPVILVSQVACSSDDSGGKSNGTGDAGSGGNSGAGNDAASGGTSSGGSSSGGSTSGDAGGAVRTPAACGSLPILGDFDPASTPADCASCVETSCCDEAKACADDAECKAFRDCAASCAAHDSACRSACSGQHAPGAKNSAFNTCRNSNCAACYDLSCVNTPFSTPTKTTYTTNWRLFNFVTGQPIAGLTVKVCDKADVDCATVLDQAVTDADGKVTVDMPSAPKATSAYMEITGPGIQPQLNFVSERNAEAALSAAGLPILDTATAAAYQGLAGSASSADGGTDGGAPTTGTIAMQVLACGNSSLAGATVSSSNAGASAVLSYIKNSLPDPSATQTDTSGIGEYVDHPVGPTTVTAKLARTGETLGTSDVFVRAGFFTTLSVAPGP